ncbi:Endoplasmic reticulum resident protein [Oopsacas minuta]|uniref:Endoplasmic reticulum resident protein n=1 Tax=Oopsacas minuta TaxID=111878 RepID=A0AAV7JQT9_9METZ|nr:Endoplasmic reticulum resident protein [Oopsacas minuta]
MSTIPLTILILTLLLQTPYTHGEALELSEDTFDEIISNNRLVFVNFYADWCRFSNMLKPIFNQAADEIAAAHEGVLLARVNCDHSKELSQRFHITKYPTMKLWRNGQQARREYRGERSVDAFKNFIEDQLKDPISYVETLVELEEKHLENVKSIVGFFEDNSTPAYTLFSKLSHSLRDDCKFIASFKSNSPLNPVTTYPHVMFRDRDLDNEVYKFGFELESAFRTWVKQKCIPLVREVTFHNGEEMTEEGLPFVLLFYDPDNLEPIKTFKQVVEQELVDQKENVNFLTADGVTFAHPLAHLGKRRSDLPFITIDSFKHMYIFPDYNEINVTGKLRQFILDLNSGKLHHEFHHGPSINVEEDKVNEPDKVRDPIQPPLSSFKNLKPSGNRYSFRDEL